MTKREILETVFNPASVKANAWMIDELRKSAFEKALDIYTNESHTASKKYLLEAKKERGNRYK